MRVILQLISWYVLVSAIAATSDSSFEEETGLATLRDATRAASLQEETDRATLRAATSTEARLTAKLLKGLVASAQQAEKADAEEQHGKVMRQKRGPPALCNGDDLHQVKLLKLRLTGRVSGGDGSASEGSSSSFLTERNGHFLDASEAAAWGGGSHDQGNTRTDLWALSLAQSKLDWLCRLDWQTRNAQERKEALAEHSEGLQDILGVYTDEKPDAVYSSENEPNLAEVRDGGKAPQYPFFSAAQLDPTQAPSQAPVAEILPLPPPLSVGDPLLPAHLDDSGLLQTATLASGLSTMPGASAVSSHEAVDKVASVSDAPRNQVFSAVQLDKPSSHRVTKGSVANVSGNATVITGGASAAPRRDPSKAPAAPASVSDAVQSPLSNAVAKQVAKEVAMMLSKNLPGAGGQDVTQASATSRTANSETAKIDMELRRELRDAAADGGEAAAAPEDDQDDAVVVGDALAPEFHDSAVGGGDASPIQGADDTTMTSDETPEPETSSIETGDGLAGDASADLEEPQDVALTGASSGIGSDVADDEAAGAELSKIRAENRNLRSALTQRRFPPETSALREGGLSMASMADEQLEDLKPSRQNGGALSGFSRGQRFVEDVAHSMSQEAENDDDDDEQSPQQQEQPSSSAADDADEE